MKHMFFKILLNILFFLSCACISCTGQTTGRNNWTILYYAAGCNSAEETMMTDLGEIKNSMKDGQGYRMIVLIDRIADFSSDTNTFGEDFNDTRLYEITAQSYKRLSGLEIFPEITQHSSYDANMGDALTLQKFIQYGKRYYPANHYALLMYSHGDGISFCADVESNRDALYPAELTDVLTGNESVELMALDVCSMGGIEVAYQWRPTKNKFSTEYLVASAPVSAPWDYNGIFSRLSAQTGDNGEKANLTSGNEQYVNPGEMSALDFGSMLIEEIYDSQPWCAWGFFDLEQSTKVKTSLDNLISSVDPELLKAAFLSAQETSIHYIPGIDPQNMFYYRMREPYFDLYNLMTKVEKKLPSKEAKQVQEVLNAIDQLVISSYYATSGNFLKPAPEFSNEKNGIYIFFPFGKEIYEPSGKTHWSEQRFYSSLSYQTEESYGNLAWCFDNATAGNNKPENWFEFLDYLFDEPDNASTGGHNSYAY
jgi:clostripain